MIRHFPNQLRFAGLLATVVLASTAFHSPAPAQDSQRDPEVAGYKYHQPAPVISPTIKRPPRATLVATPAPVPRAKLVATPAPVPRAALVATPTPVPWAALVPMPTPIATPLLTPTPDLPSSLLNQPATSTSRPSEVAVSPPISLPVPAVPAPQNQAPVIPWGGILFFVVLLAGGFVANRSAARAKKRNAEAPKQRKTMVYHIYAQYQQAHQVWLREGTLFAQAEAARLAALEKKVKEGGPLSGLGCLGFIVAALLVGTVFGAGAGWGTVIVGVFVLGLISGCEQRFRRWRWKEQLKARVFAEVVPEPVYEEPCRDSTPPPPQNPPPRRDAAPPSSPRDNVRVTSLRQAFEILGMAPGRTTLSVARAAYRARMAEYHPDKTMHLGKELRELAARKALEINLAMQFIEENCTRPTVVPGQSASRSSPPPVPKTEPSKQVFVDQILRFKNAVPFRPFSIEIRQSGQAPSTTDKAFFIRYPEWVWLKDDTSIALRTDNTDHTYVIPLTEIERVAQGVYAPGPQREGDSDQKTEEPRSGNENGSIYPEDSIVSAAEDDPRRIFVRGPFDSLEDDAFCDPYVLDLDYIAEMGPTYISINFVERPDSMWNGEGLLARECHSRARLARRLGLG